MTPAFLRALLGVVALAAGGLLAGSVARSSFGGVQVVDEPDVAMATRAAPGMAVGPAEGVPVLRIFGDYECSACRALEREAGDSLRALARRGRIRFVYHHAPLRAHRRGPDAAAAAYCATKAGGAWPGHRALSESAAEWATGPDGERRIAAAVAAAIAAAGPTDTPDTAALLSCMRNDGVIDRVAADRAAAAALGINELPTIFLESQRLRVRSWGALVRFVTARAASP